MPVHKVLQFTIHSGFGNSQIVSFIGLFSRRICNLKNPIGKLKMRNRVCFFLLWRVCGFPIRISCFGNRDEKRPMKETICSFQNYESVVIYNTFARREPQSVVIYNTFLLWTWARREPAVPLRSLTKMCFFEKCFQKASLESQDLVRDYCFQFKKRNLQKLGAF